MAVKPKDLAWEQELLQRRLEFVRQLKATLEDYVPCQNEYDMVASFRALPTPVAGPSA